MSLFRLKGTGSFSSQGTKRALLRYTCFIHLCQCNRSQNFMPNSLTKNIAFAFLVVRMVSVGTVVVPTRNNKPMS